MLEVWADTEKNRLHLRHLGPLADENAARYAERVLQEVERLRPGFDVVSDLRQAGPLGQEMMRMLQGLVAAGSARGIGRHVMLVGRSVETTLQLQRISKVVGHEGFLAFSMEEAERLLESQRT